VGFFVCGMMGRFDLPMNKVFLLLIFIFSSLLYSQDYLTTVSGKEYEGQYIGFKDGKVQFIQKGAVDPTQIPSSSVKNVKLANGKTLSFGSELLMNDGTNFTGSWIMTSKDFIRFLVTGDNIYTDFDRSSVKSVIYPDGKSIDLEKITDPVFLVTTMKDKDVLIVGQDVLILKSGESYNNSEKVIRKKFCCSCVMVLAILLYDALSDPM
jgi:hypothetical protein